MVHIWEACGLCNTERQDLFAVMNQKGSVFKYVELIHGLGMECFKNKYNV